MPPKETDNQNRKKFGFKKKNDILYKQHTDKKGLFWNAIIHIPVIHFLYRHKNFVFLFLSILCILAISHVKYVGNFFDFFVFATFFGYFRYVFYAFVFVTLIIFTLNLERQLFFRHSLYFLLFALFLGSSWSYVIVFDQNKLGTVHNSYSFSNCWAFFKNQYSEAWHHVGHAFSSYNLMPGGVFGVLLYSCFYIFQNPTAAQVIFWITTLLVFFISLGYFVFHDLFFLVRCLDAIKLLVYELWNTTRTKFVKHNEKPLGAAISINTDIQGDQTGTHRRGTGSHNFFYQLKHESNPRAYAKHKLQIPRSQGTVYDPNDRIENSFSDRTREIIRSTILKKYVEQSSQNKFAEYQDDKVNVGLMKNNMNTFFQNSEPSSKWWAFWRRKSPEESATDSTKAKTNFKFNDQKTLQILRNQLLFFKYNEARFCSKWPIFNFSKLSFQVQQQNRFEIQNYAREKENKLLQIFLANKIKARIVKINVSSKFIQYEMTIPNNVMINRIRSLKDNIKLGLSEQNVFLEIPIKNKNTFGVEISNPFSSIITFKQIFKKLIKNGEFTNLCHKLYIGRKSSGKNVITKLSDLPHLLIAGATGSGKSVELRNIILSLALTNPSHKLNLILIDPKKVEFRTFYDLPHLLTPIIYSYEKIVAVLDKLILEMENRYKILRRFKCINIDQYNAQQKNEQLHLPKIVVVFDEFADFILRGKRQLEMKIVRVSQLSRAAGIHLILATQHPSSKVITGLIKINFPSRIAFACSSGIDSRIVLDSAGAEELLGNGDMLYISAQNYRPIRLQAPFIDQQNTEIICNFLRQIAQPNYVDELYIDYEETNELTMNRRRHDFK